MNIRELAEKNKDYAVLLRRHFHMYPELSFKEFETAKKVKEELEKLDIECRFVTETGVVAEIGKKGSKAVALRADMDALEVNEARNLEFQSKNQGVMHACGHDAHTAALLSAAKMLKEIDDKEGLPGRVKLIFQPAEELILGSSAMMEADNFMDDVGAVFGIHNMPEYDAGTICYRDSGMMFAGRQYTVNIIGKSGHGSSPEGAIDALMVGAEIALAFNNIIAREIDARDPAVITTGKLESGTRHNIIAGKAFMTGTYRCYKSEVAKLMEEAMERVAKSIAEAYRAEASIEWGLYVPPVVNDPAIGEIVRGAAKKIVRGGEEIIQVDSMKGSDDFSFYLTKVPGYYAFVGSGVKDENERFPIHSEKFLLDENFLVSASAMHVQFALDYLEVK